MQACLAMKLRCLYPTLTSSEGEIRLVIGPALMLAFRLSCDDCDDSIDSMSPNDTCDVLLTFCDPSSHSCSSSASIISLSISGLVKFTGFVVIERTQVTLQHGLHGGGGGLQHGDGQGSSQQLEELGRHDGHEEHELDWLLLHG